MADSPARVSCPVCTHTWSGQVEAVTAAPRGVKVMVTSTPFSPVRDRVSGPVSWESSRRATSWPFCSTTATVPWGSRDSARYSAPAASSSAPHSTIPRGERNFFPSMGASHRACQGVVPGAQSERVLQAAGQVDLALLGDEQGLAVKLLQQGEAVLYAQHKAGGGQGVAEGAAAAPH